MDEKQSPDGSVSDREQDRALVPVIKSSPALLPNLQQLRQVTDVVAMGHRQTAVGPRPRFELTSLVGALPEPVRPAAPPIVPAGPLLAVRPVEHGLIAPTAPPSILTAPPSILTAPPSILTAVDAVVSPHPDSSSVSFPPAVSQPLDWARPAASPLVPAVEPRIEEPTSAQVMRAPNPLAERLSSVPPRATTMDAAPHPTSLIAPAALSPLVARASTIPAAKLPQAGAPKPAARSLLRSCLRLVADAVRFGLIAFAAWFVTVVVLIAAFRFADPPQSMLMLTKRLGGQTLQHQWVPLERVAPSLRRAVITSEDGKFCRHWGFDLGEIRAALKSGEGGGRGASTITQQLAKNLFLWPGKSYIRKAIEVPLTLAMEGMWPKRRILEVYLNVAEWGPGVFGAEAAAQYYYNKPASALSDRESALLAVSLPNPIARDASDPDPAIARRASTLQARMRVQGISYCALTGSAARPQPR